jgi:hypothetical protein
LITVCDIFNVGVVTFSNSFVGFIPKKFNTESKLESLKSESKMIIHWLTGFAKLISIPGKTVIIFSNSEFDLNS